MHVWPTSRTTSVAVVALGVALAIWLGYGYLALQPGATLVRPADQGWFFGLLVGGAVLDVVVAIRSLRGRVGGLALVWLGVRVVLSAAGLLFVTIPSYAVALFTLSRPPAPDTRVDPMSEHAFRPVSAGWFAALTPTWWSRNLVGARHYGARRCAICGEPEIDPMHGASTEGRGDAQDDSERVSDA